jgi:hypothetical protein
MVELEVMVMSPHLTWRRGSNAAKEGGHILEIQSRPRKPKIKEFYVKHVMVVVNTI